MDNLTLLCISPAQCLKIANNVSIQFSNIVRTAAVFRFSGVSGCISILFIDVSTCDFQLHTLQ